MPFLSAIRYLCTYTITFLQGLLPSLSFLREAACFSGVLTLRSDLRQGERWQEDCWTCVSILRPTGYRDALSQAAIGLENLCV